MASGGIKSYDYFAVFAFSYGILGFVAVIPRLIHTDCVRIESILYSAYSFHTVFDFIFFEFQLGSIGHMLKGASSAGLIVGAGWLSSFRR